MKDQKTLKVFILEDDVWYGSMLQHHLSLNPDYEVKRFENSKAFFACLHEQPDVVTLDYSLPDMDGTEVLKKIKANKPELKIIIRAWIGAYLEKVDSRRIDPGAVDWLLCHYSARSLRQEIVTLMQATGAMIPEEKWFTTLPTTGNVGSASIFLMLDALAKNDAVRSGDQVLCIVPESGRAMVGFMMLEVVA